MITIVPSNACLVAKYSPLYPNPNQQVAFTVGVSLDIIAMIESLKTTSQDPNVFVVKLRNESAKCLLDKTHVICVTK